MQGWTSGKESKYIQSFQVSYGTSRLSMSLYEDIPGTVKVGGTLAGWLWVPGEGVLVQGQDGGGGKLKCLPVFNVWYSIHYCIIL